MFDAAPAALLEPVARALHARLHAPLDAKARRVAELGFLAEQLEREPQDPNFLPRLKQDTYEERRRRLAPNAPSAETLVRLYSSWKHACYAAYGLRIDGSKDGRGLPWPTIMNGLNRGTSCTREECIESIGLCAEALGRRPMSGAYREWRLNRLARARQSGQEVRLASIRQILTQLAPERGHREGWQIALGQVFGDDA